MEGLKDVHISTRGRAATFWVRPDTSDRKAIEEVWDRGTYEKPRLGFRVGAGEDWVDGGANVGAFSRLVLESGSSVTAYEPEPSNCQLTRLNAPGASLVEACITLKGGPVKLHVQPKPLQQRRHSILAARKGSRLIEVPSVSWRQAIDGKTGCKLNIEGAEIEILTSLPDLGDLQKLVFEWSFDIEPRVNVLRRVIEWLETKFMNVRSSRKLIGDRWVHFPPNCFVHAWGRQ